MLRRRATICNRLNAAVDMLQSAATYCGECQKWTRLREESGAQDDEAVQGFKQNARLSIFNSSDCVTSARACELMLDFDFDG